MATIEQRRKQQYAAQIAWYWNIRTKKAEELTKFTAQEAGDILVGPFDSEDEAVAAGARI